MCEASEVAAGEFSVNVRDNFIAALRRRFESEKHMSTAISIGGAAVIEIFEILQPAVGMFLAEPASNAVAER